jgi:uncharacterized protein involved in exopolysaccharide biosynthesis
MEDPAMEGYARKPLPTARDLVAVLFRHRLAMFIAFIIVIVAAALSGKWVPTYEAKMKILVLRQRTDAIVSSSATLPAPFNGDHISEEDLNSEVELLNSEDLLRKVVMTTGLAIKDGSSNGHASNVEIARAVRKLDKDLKVEAGRKSNVISVSYTSHNPRLAARVLQALSTAYTQKHLEMNHDSGEFNFFNQQAQQYMQGLEQAQAKLTDFTQATGVVSAQIERDDALAHANEFDATAHQTQTTIFETQHRIQMLRGQLRSMQPRMTTVVRTSDNPQLLQELKSTLLNLELKRTELLTKYQPTYRLVQEVDKQIADTKSAIAAEGNKPIRDQSTDENPTYQWVQAELAKAQADLSGLKAREASAASIAGTYHEAAQRLDQDELVQRDLLQNAKTQEENYLLYVHKREEARINDALDQRGIVNVAMAEMPVVPALPTQSVVNFALAVVMLAGVFSFAVAFAIDLTDPTFRTPDELANYMGVPVLAALPKVSVG